MATNINTILGWFKTGLKPTQPQFWATWASFWHKDEQIPQSNIFSLENDLNRKAEKSQVDNHLNDKDAHTDLFDKMVSTLTPSEVNFIPKFSGANILSNSRIFDNGQNVIIGSTNSNGRAALQVTGSITTDNLSSKGNVSVNSSGNYEQGLSISGQTSIIIQNGYTSIRYFNTEKFKISANSVDFSTPVIGLPAENYDQFVTKAQTDSKANLDSPILTGIPTAPTAILGANTAQIATTAFVQANTPTSGSFMPTLTNTVNVSSSVVLNGGGTYTKVGNIVNGQISINITAIEAGSITGIDFTLPVLKTNGTFPYVGTVTTINGTSFSSGYVKMVAQDSKASIIINPATAGDYTIIAQFQYKIN